MDSIIESLGISQEDYINTVNECIFDKSIQPGDKKFLDVELRKNIGLMENGIINIKFIKDDTRR